MVPNEETFEGAGGLKIFMRSWRPAGAPKAIVVISHGFNSHSGQYLWVAEQLAAKGFAVYAHDYRGRGLSEGERFHVEHVDEYVGDLAQVVGIAKARDPGLPVYVLGHSAGGVIASTYALDHQADIAGLIAQAMALIDAGDRPRTGAKPPKAPLPVHPAFATAIAAAPAAAAIWAAFPPGKIRDYCEWINEAKTDATRDKRIAQAVDWIGEGKGRNWKYEKK